MRRFSLLLAAVVLAAGISAAPRHLVSRIQAGGDFVHFESAHVHPVAMTPDGNRLLVVNTPDNRLSVFSLAGAAPVRIAEIPVGLEPVSVAALDDNTAWVVNHLSDDVSVVDLTTMHVRATVRTGDEPNDVVFAGSAAPDPGPLAYVSVSQEDVVKAYNPNSLGLVATIPIDGRMPRALARTSDGSRVYVAVFQAGNRTSVLSALEVGDSLPPPNPPLKNGLPPPPPVGLIVQQQSGTWRDELGRNWGPTGPTPNGPGPKIAYTLFDVDVAQINTATETVVDTVSDIGAVNFGIAVSPNGTVAVTATEARNFRRFEPNVRGHMVDARAALISPGGAVTPVELNPTIGYGTTPGPATDLDVAIGLPTGVAWSGDNQSFYVAAFANDRIIQLGSSGTILARSPTVAGPTGVLVDDARGRIYVVGRFHNQLQTLNRADLSSYAVASIGMDPTPDPIVNGRKFFYGGFTSGHGEQACATCHLFGDFDNLAWDLGNPQGEMQPVDLGGQTLAPILNAQVHPMKGPMTTQSLRGLAAPTYGDFHWRADRRDLDAFNPAFVNLMGRAGQLPDSEMTAFNDFVLPLVYPPNPRQNLDRSYPDAPLHTPSARRGRIFFFNQPTDGPLTCNGCHTATTFGPGTNGQIVNNEALQESQDMKVPQLRNMYVKTGFTDFPGALDKRGFGFTHDGAVDNLFTFLHFPGFNFNQPATQTPDENRRDVESFLLSFDTGMAPAVGFQITFNGPNNNSPPLLSQLQTLRDQFDSTFIDLVAKGRIGTQPRGWLYVGGDLWDPDKVAEPHLTTAQLLALATGTGSAVTVTGVPKGSGTRMGIDRDRDSYPDGDELDAGSDPGNPASTPANVGVAGVPGTGYGLEAVKPNPTRGPTEVVFRLGQAGRVDVGVYDVLGRVARVVAHGAWYQAGRQSVSWDGRRGDGSRAGTGVYFVKVRTAGGRWTRPLVMTR